MLVQRLAELKQSLEDPRIWDDHKKANSILKETKTIENKLDRLGGLMKRYNDNLDIASLLEDENDESMELDLEKDLHHLKCELEKFKIECFFTGEMDICNSFLEIHAGAGGTESHDWASMLMRMYLRFAEKMGFKTEIINMISGEEAGIKSCTMKISGENAFGWLRSESGVHRLVRISPFNAAGKRMTSFSSVWAYPEIDDSFDIEIEDKDLRIDTYRASGAGGQHINTTDSAVRITHIPTGIVTQCQSGRSQHKNKAEAMKMLKSRLYEAKMQEKQKEFDKNNAEKTDIGWGHQIRSYVLQPYQMVKDLRTGHERSDVNKILDGNLERFIATNLSNIKPGQ